MHIATWNENNLFLSHTVAQYTRLFQKWSLFKVNGGISRIKPCLEPLERALLLTVFGQVVVAPFEF